MATQYPTAPEALTALPHAVALPYRGDGVACALRATYIPDDDCIPNDMIALLIAIDEQALITDPDLVS
jgi:hypothetical protein